MVAALAHDVKHPGLNNSYHINSRSEIALIYNDTSVLENYHVSETYKILKNKELNIFEKYITSNTINVDLGFKICAYMWTSTQLKPLCVCDSHMRIECHYNNYYYVCLQCKSLSHSTKEEN